MSSSDVETALKNLIESITKRPAYPDYIIMSQKNINQIKNVFGTFTPFNFSTRTRRTKK